MVVEYFLYTFSCGLGLLLSVKAASLIALVLVFDLLACSFNLQCYIVYLITYGYPAPNYMMFYLFIKLANDLTDKDVLLVWKFQL